MRVQVDAGGKSGAAVLQMDMGILKARQHQPAPGIDQSGAPIGRFPDLPVAADRRDPAVINGYCGGARPQLVHASNVGIEDDPVPVQRSYSYGSISFLAAEHQPPGAAVKLDVPMQPVKSVGCPKYRAGIAGM